MKFLRRALKVFNGDVEGWANWLGYELIHTDVFPKDYFGALLNGKIYVRENSTPLDQTLTVAHEDCHLHFHASCVAFRERDDHSNTKEERQARMYAAGVAVPSLEGIETAEVFMRTTDLTDIDAKLRVDLYFKYEQKENHRQILI